MASHRIALPFHSLPSPELNLSITEQQPHPFLIFNLRQGLTKLLKLALNFRTVLPTAVKCRVVGCILQAKKLKLREGKELAKGHTAPSAACLAVLSFLQHATPRPGWACSSVPVRGMARCPLGGKSPVGRLMHPLSPPSCVSVPSAFCHGSRLCH